MAFQHRVVHLAAREHVGKRMADKLAHAQLALRGAWGLIAALVAHDDVIKGQLEFCRRARARAYWSCRSQGEGSRPWERIRCRGWDFLGICIEPDFRRLPAGSSAGS